MNYNKKEGIEMTYKYLINKINQNIFIREKGKNNNNSNISPIKEENNISIKDNVRVSSSNKVIPPINIIEKNNINRGIRRKTIRYQNYI